MGTESFSKGLVEIISSSDESAKIEEEFLQVLQALNGNSEALDVFRNFGIPADKKMIRKLKQLVISFLQGLLQ